ncbi:unnamed protein product [Parnassius apollo]|uniref:(apollo) hypothetical protein n=1 Tax=Parnassius apollo TaxID=110799 RepID=A0A8S3X3J9_PARAO|nr:unnamed protein product [Parnassius apollo]
MKGKEGAIRRGEGVERGKRDEASTRALRSANVRNRSNEARRRVRPIQPSSMRPQLTRAPRHERSARNRVVAASLPARVA